MKQIIILLISVIVVAVVGCSARSSKITAQNYERIHEGMARAEVIAILGQPTGKEAVAEMNGKKTTGDEWQDGHTKIVIAFSPDEKLLVKSIEVD